MNYEGLSLLEKMDIWFNKSEYNFKEVQAFHGESVVLKENIVFVGKHAGSIQVAPNAYFIHRGEIEGDLLISKESKVLIFGKIIGDVIADNALDLRNGSSVNGTIFAKKISLQKNVKISGKVTLKP